VAHKRPDTERKGFPGSRGSPQGRNKQRDGGYDEKPVIPPWAALTDRPGPDKMPVWLGSAVHAQKEHVQKKPEADCASHGIGPSAKVCPLNGKT